MRLAPVHLPLIARAAALATLSFLSACGGGGASSSADSGVQSGGALTLGGVVSKGLTGNANVRVLGVTGGGTVDSANVLATAVTNPDGSYTTAAFTAPVVYVVEVAAKDCADTIIGTGCSYQQDEATHARQYLPTGFKMRAVVTGVPADGRVNVTPFSELAVAAAEKASGGLTFGNADSALNMVNQLVGVTDLNAVLPTTLDQASTPDQVRLAALLTAVSRMASSPSALTAVACAATSGTPDATKCVVEKLAANANTAGTFVGDTAAVTTALSDELTAAVASNAEAQSLVTVTLSKLTDPTITVIPSTVASGIDKAKAFFSDLTSTVRTLVDSGATPGQGAFLNQAHVFQNAVKDMDFQADTLSNSVQALYLATKLWSDYEHGGTALTADIFQDISSPLVKTGIHCNLLKQGVGGSVSVQVGDNASVVSSVECYADATFDIDWSQGSGSYPLITYPYKNGYQHFVVTKGGANAFNYVASERLDISNVTLDHQAGTANLVFPDPACPQSSNGACSGERVFTGTVATTVDGAGRLASIHMVGNLPDGWAEGSVLAHASAGGSNLAKSAVDITASVSGTYANAGLGADLQSGALSFMGGNVAYAADGATEESRITFASGSQVSVANNTFQGSTLNLTVLTPSSKLTGTLTGQSAANKGGAGTFTGALYNRAQSETVPFISASVAVTLTRPVGFDSSQPISSTNSQSAVVSFDGFVTAPGHPKLRIILAAAAQQSSSTLVWGTSAEDTASGNCTVYNADGTTLRDVSFTVISPNHDGKTLTALTDVASGIAMNIQDGQDMAKVLVDGAEVGVLNTHSSKVSFKNGDFLSLDFGTVVYSD